MAVEPDMRKITPPIERFYRHVKEDGDCLIWTGMVAGTKSTYGYFRATTNANDPKVLAHRWHYEYWIGPIPEGHQLDHVKEKGCKSTLCVKLDHLQPVTPAENMERTRLKTCRSGKHDLTNPANVRWDALGRRRGCLRCWLDRAAERQAGNGGQ